ncbi:GNAT family N-acetyltransferase [uncultured Nocardioides sp.]|uniref:GNAT family N-acetyltransferase n=1 Tax=uncultured Nocardioides sp. TaxID=198441 RepID=UPI00260C315A|nr:GNAT family N-acetyltransferase [uncultured Nocardioides sp.]
MTQTGALPPLEVLVDAADTGLHPWVREHVPAAVRHASLEQELGFWLGTAAQDLTHAEQFASVAPPRGQPVEAYLDRWLPLGDGSHVLAGPRYLGRDPDLPFVGISGSDRPLRPTDQPALRALAQRHFAPFAPGFVLLWASDPVGAWPGAGTEMRQVVGTLVDLATRETPPELSTAVRRDIGCYDRYRAIHEAHVAAEPEHARHARCEDEEDLLALAEAGLVHDVLVDGEWAGLVAAEPDDRRGVPGMTVVELLLDHHVRGRGFGRHLSTLLARALPASDRSWLTGTIHADNHAAYRAALAAGRVDVGGEVRVPV